MAETPTREAVTEAAGQQAPSGPSAGGAAGRAAMPACREFPMNTSRRTGRRARLDPGSSMPSLS